MLLQQSEKKMEEKNPALTFLHLANAMIVIKFPGTPTKMYTMHVTLANVIKPDGYPSNSLASEKYV